jgi:hypothetical protein
MMVVIWLGIPATATVLAILWVLWSTRVKETDIHHSLQSHERFRAALQHEVIGGLPAKTTEGSAH